MKKGLILGLAGATLFVAACSADPLSIPNPNSPTIDGIRADTAALQLQVTGVVRNLRGGLTGYITAVARFGREGYIYTPNEGRNTSHYLIGLAGQNKLDPSGFATGVWGGNYTNLRDLHNLKKVITDRPDLTAAQRSAANGFAHTIEALELLYVISTRDLLGAIVQINDDPLELAPFVSRDSVYRYIIGTLNAAEIELAAGGAAFPFALHAGFAGFNTPVTFRQVNRAITARAAVYFATRGGGATAWTQAQTAIAASFLNRNAPDATAMNTGAYHVYSTSTGDAANGLGANADFLAHPTYATDVAAGDLRASKWVVLAVPRNAPQGLGIATNLRIARYASTTANVPIIRNEELILLDAEIRWNTGDRAGAVTDIDRIRSVSGGAGIGATTVTAGSTDTQFVTEILAQRRFSLFAEGHRWVDTRRYNLLNTLPRDITTGTTAHFIARVMPVPQAECLVRAREPNPALAGPGC